MHKKRIEKQRALDRWPKGGRSTARSGEVASPLQKPEVNPEDMTTREKESRHARRTQRTFLHGSERVRTSCSYRLPCNLSRIERLGRAGSYIVQPFSKQGPWPHACRKSSAWSGAGQGLSLVRVSGSDHRACSQDEPSPGPLRPALAKWGPGAWLPSSLWLRPQECRQNLVAANLPDIRIDGVLLLQ